VVEVREDEAEGRQARGEAEEVGEHERVEAARAGDDRGGGGALDGGVAPAPFPAAEEPGRADVRGEALV
jgi:hypothetical protein